MASYEGNTYQTESGQWGWYINEDGEQICTGTGFTTREEAYSAMHDEFCRVQMEGGCSY